MAFESKEDLPSQINILLDCLRQSENGKADEKDRRGRKKQLEQAIIQLMIDADLTVVRILTHEFGPCDIMLKTVEKKRALTIKCIKEELVKFKSEPIDDAVLKQVEEQLTAPTGKFTRKIQVKKLMKKSSS